MSTASAPSNRMTRWFAPLLLIWAQLLLSGWVYAGRLPEDAKAFSLTLLLVLLGTPCLSLVFWVLLFRFSNRPPEAKTRSGDLLTVWILTFLFGVQACFLATAIGVLPSMHQALGVTLAVLWIGLGPLLGELEFRHVMGIRTRATLGSQRVWQSTHRLAARLFPVAGLFGLSALLSPRRAMLLAPLIPAVAVVFALIYHARQEEKAAPNEAENTDSPEIRDEMPK